MEIIDKITAYVKLKAQIREELSSFEPINIDSDQLIHVLGELMKDSAFEAKVFQLMLKISPNHAKEHLDLYYLGGTPNGKTRFKGNLDVMLHDYKEVLGQAQYQKLLDSIPESTKRFYAVKEAIEISSEP